MASLLVGRHLANYGIRQSANTLTLSRHCQQPCNRTTQMPGGSAYTHSRRSQQTYAARAPSNRPCEPSQSSRTPVVPVFRLAEKHRDRTALRDRHGEYTYKGIFQSSKKLSEEISSIFRGKRCERVAFLCPNDASYIIAQWACWMSGHIAVPLSPTHPASVLEYCITDSDAKLLLTTSENAEFMGLLSTKTNRQLIVIEDSLRVASMKVAKEEGAPKKHNLIRENFQAGQEQEFYNDSDALIIYTSGTTGSPKGVVLTHLNLQSQVNSMLQAWSWSDKDIILHTLPLNHMHGIVNALLCPLYAGARCVMHPRFEANHVWSSLLAIRTPQTERPNLYMGVPTMYSMLIQEYDKNLSKNPRIKEYVRNVCSQKIRLMVTGSSRLPPSVFDRWEEITGHRLLERYGMSETGMVLSNLLDGERKPGYVGIPLPGVEVRIAEQKIGSAYEILVKGNSSGSIVLAPKGYPLIGELLVKGPIVFREYFHRPKATKKEFTADGWFKTGDTCEYNAGSYQILGRTSVDIIKTGGYKVSALEVEAKLLMHPDIAECAIVGLPDITWGHKIAAVVIPREGRKIILPSLRDWARNHLASYAIPTVLKVVNTIPKNQMGKINKKHLVKAIFPEVEKIGDECPN